MSLKEKTQRDRAGEKNIPQRHQQQKEVNLIFNANFVSSLFFKKNIFYFKILFFFIFFSLVCQCAVQLVYTEQATNKICKILTEIKEEENFVLM